MTPAEIQELHFATFACWDCEDTGVVETDRGDYPCRCPAGYTYAIGEILALYIETGRCK